jgi:hypothetical protein
METLPDFECVNWECSKIKKAKDCLATAVIIEIVN